MKFTHVSADYGCSRAPDHVARSAAAALAASAADSSSGLGPALALLCAAADAALRVWRVPRFSMMVRTCMRGALACQCRARQGGKLRRVPCHADKDACWWCWLATVM